MPAPDPKGPLNAYLNLQVKADREVLAILRSIQRDIKAQLQTLGGDSPGVTLRRAQILLAQREIDAAIRRGWANLADIVEAEALAAGEVAVRANGDFDRALLRQGLSDAQIAVLTKGQIASAQQNVRAALNRVLDDTGSTNIPLSTKVYHARALVNGEVDRLVNSALARGLNAREFAKEVGKFIDPNTPGGLRYAAMRLSRTEINNSFHHAQRRDNAAKPWVTGQKWYLSGSHPRPDECNDFAEQNRFDLGQGVFPKGDVPNKPHPHCLCYIAPEVVSEEQWVKDFKAGKYDDYLDQRIPAGLSGKPFIEPTTKTKSIRRGRVKVPSTPANVKTANKALKGVRSSNAKRVDQYWDAATDAERKAWKDAIVKRAGEDVHVRMNADGLKGFAEDGRYKTAHERAEEAAKRGHNYLRDRTDYEDDFMGLGGVSAAERPVYGYTGPFDQGAVSGYGDYTVTLKRGVRDRTTVSAGDSLNGALDVHNPAEVSGLSDARLKRMTGADNASALRDGKFVQFMEAQIHGGLTLKDIDFVTVPSNASAELLSLLRRNGIKYKVELSEEDKLLAELARKFKK